MSIFTRQKRPTNPVQSEQLTDSLIVNCWAAKNEDGIARLHWNVRRVNPADPTKPFATIRIEQILEMPEFLSSLSRVASQLEGLPERLRVSLGEFAVVMENVAARLKANGPLPEDGKSESMGLAALKF